MDIDQAKLEALKKTIQKGNIASALDYIRYEVGCDLPGHFGKLLEVNELLNWWISFERAKGV